MAGRLLQLWVIALTTALLISILQFDKRLSVWVTAGILIVGAVVICGLVEDLKG